MTGHYVVLSLRELYTQTKQTDGVVAGEDLKSIFSNIVTVNAGHEVVEFNFTSLKLRSSVLKQKYKTFELRCIQLALVELRHIRKNPFSF